MIEAAYHLQRPLAGQMTAAGKITPAKVLVVGAGEDAACCPRATERLAPAAAG